jgi:hypothetical protein
MLKDVIETVNKKLESDAVFASKYKAASNRQEVLHLLNQSGIHVTEEMIGQQQLTEEELEACSAGWQWYWVCDSQDGEKICEKHRTP